MKKTYELPEDLIKSVRQLSGVKSKKIAIIVALEEYVRTALVKSLLSRVHSKNGFGISHSQLRKNRNRNEY